MTHMLAAVNIDTVGGVVILFVVLGAAAACFAKTLPAILCLSVAMILLVVR